jgi:hypothetical protein
LCDPLPASSKHRGDYARLLLDRKYRSYLHRPTPPTTGPRAWRHCCPRVVPSHCIDIAIVSSASQDYQTATLPFVTTEDDAAAQRAAKLVEKHLNAVAREKRRRNPPLDRPFRPFVLSLGGMMETEARDALKLWKSIMTVGVYSLLIRRLSLGFLRAGARCFEL